MFEDLKECSLCRERVHVKTAKGAIDSPVSSCGSFDSPVLLLGRNPGVMEIRRGEPFVGPAGDRLNTILLGADIPRKICYTTNVVKCFTPSGVGPSIGCRRRCIERWLTAELSELKRLKLIITFGNEALQYFEPDALVSQMHGYSVDEILEGSGLHVPIFVMFHPSAALRDSRINEKVVEDTILLSTFWAKRNKEIK